MVSDDNLFYDFLHLYIGFFLAFFGKIRFNMGIQQKEKNMAFNEETVANVANLARLNLTDEQKQKFAGEVDGILNWVEQLQEVNVNDIEPLISVTEQTDAIRADIVTDGDIQADLMKNAPESAHGFYVVPKMVE